MQCNRKLLGILGKYSILGAIGMSVTVSIKVKKNVLELVDKMVKYGLARSRNQALNILIEKGLESIKDEIRYWDEIYCKSEELVKKGFKLSHGGLNKILEEVRSR